MTIKDKRIFRLQPSTLQLLRFHFGFFLLPVYLFALTQTVYTNWWKALLVFVILHLLVYPASNGYNSYMDRDDTPIGGIRHPMKPTLELLQVVNVMDLAAILLSFLISIWFTAGILIYILASRAYSSRQIRVKRYPLAGFLLVINCQGALVFWMVYHGVHSHQPIIAPFIGMLASSLLIGGAYPLTQVYQHAADSKDGIRSISILLGIKGTFILSALFFTLAFLLLGIYFALQLELSRFLVLAICFLPVLVFFMKWMRKVWQNKDAANFDNLMTMNKLSAFCSNTGFLLLLIWKLFD